MALRAIYDLERSLNPGRFDWDDARRGWPGARGWTPAEVQALHWLVNLIVELLGRCGIEPITGVDDAEAWVREHLGAIEAVSFEMDRLEAFREATDGLPAVESVDLLIEDGMIFLDGDEFSVAEAKIRFAGGVPPRVEHEVGFQRKALVSLAATPNVAGTVASVVLDGPHLAPIVLGNPVGALAPAQYHVVAAQLAAGDAGLSLQRLKEESGHSDARNIVDRLRSAHPETWGRVLIMPGSSRTSGYRIGAIGDPKTPPF